MERKYFKKGIVEIEEIVKEDSSKKNINAIIHELGFRNTARAKKLLDKLTSSEQPDVKEKKRLIADNKTEVKNTKKSKPASDKEQTSQKQKIIHEPVNTETSIEGEKFEGFDEASEVLISSNNDTSIDSANSKLKETESFFQNFCDAIDIEVEEIKKKSLEQVIEITNGSLLESNEEGHIYQFLYKEAFNIREDIPVIITIGGAETSATIVSFRDKKLQISVPENYGKLIGFAQIKIDNSYLLTRLKEKIEEVTSGEDKTNFNSHMAKKVLGEEDSFIGIDETIPNESQLNKEQHQSLKVAAKSEVMYLWGPPGTGKTFTLAKVIDMFYKQNKRILLVSNTNLAVDLLLKSLCKHLKNIQDKNFLNSSVLRFGKIQDTELENSYGEFINIDKAVEKRGEVLSKERDVLRSEIESIKINEKKWLELETKEKEHQVCLAKFNRAEEVINKSYSKQNEADNEVKNIQEYIEILKKEIKKSEGVGTLKRFLTNKRKPEEIKFEIEEEKKQLISLEADSKKIQIKNKELENTNKSLEQELNKLHKAIKDVNFKEIKKDLKEAKEKISKNETRINEISNEMDSIKTEIINNCKILAATATKVFLKAENFKNFDVVIIDESSMLPLPLVAYVSGLSKEKVTVTGDFRQLPPIVSANKDTGVMKWIGTNVFQKAGIEAAIEKGKAPDNLVNLTMQYRMRKPICELINTRFYDGALATDKSVNSEYEKAKNGIPKFFKNPLMIIDTSKLYPFANIKPRTFSKYNISHALVVRNLLHHLQNNGYTNNPNELGVISPFAAQAELIQKLIDEKNVSNVVSGTVHRFQGNEKDIIFFDLVESFGNLYISKNVDDSKLINVALSRAKYHLVFIGNIQYLNKKLAKNSPMRSVLSEVIKKGDVIDAKNIINLGPSSYDVELNDINPKKIDFDDNGSKFFDQKTFDKAVFEDVKRAKKSVVIFSGFSTPNRIALWSDLFRQKISEGVKIRCVTRSPKNQGSISEELVQEALDALTKIGVIVDLRYEIHEKAVFIDEHIFWYGSLNPLSHTGKTEESMLRVPSKELCLLKAKYEIYKRGYKNEDSPFSIITEKENPDCPKCNKLITFHHRGRFGPYYHCESCQWKESVDKFNSNNFKKQNYEDIPIEKDIKCEVCSKKMILKKSRFGHFYGCTDYPKCKNTVKAQ